VGGGSPNLLATPELQRLLVAFRRGFSGNVNMELHPECSAVSGYVRSLPDIGVNSVSVGLQTCEETVLNATRRGHDTQTLRRLVRQIQTTPLKLNIDVMYGGLLGESQESASRTFRYVFEELQPDTVHAYQACYTSGTQEHRAFRRDSSAYPSAQQIVEATAMLYAVAENNGYYDIGMGYFGRDPAAQLTTRGRQTAALAVGPGTYTRIHDEPGRRGWAYFAPYDIDKYVAQVGAKQFPIDRMVVLDEEDVERWGAIVDLRFRIPISRVCSPELTRILERMESEGLLTQTEDGVVVESTGILLENLVCSSLLPRKMWVALEARQRREDYGPRESIYDWYSDPGTVLRFLDFLDGT
jgi:coproporphyrinogen III oxidase-like Fe-S oxidoreductase